MRASVLQNVQYNERIGTVDFESGIIVVYFFSNYMFCMVGEQLEIEKRRKKKTSSIILLLGGNCFHEHYCLFLCTF